MVANFFSSLKLENGLKKHVRNVARIKHGFVELVVNLFTLNTGSFSILIWKEKMTNF